MNIEWIIDRQVGILHSPQNPTVSDKTIADLARRGFDVIVTTADYDYSISWKVGSETTLRHYQCAFGNYPEPSNWELQHLNEYLLYEIDHYRKIVMWFQDDRTGKSISTSISRFFKYDDLGLSTFVKSKLASQAERAKNIPPKLTHCQACEEKGCITELVCHVTSVADAKEILKSGILLSACEVRGESGQTLALEERNAAADPPDYFEYVMFTFGNCTAGDNLVMERELGRLPTQKELTEMFRPGVRFYFRYADLVGHPGFCSDGHHFFKIKDSLEIDPYLVVVIAPVSATADLSGAVPTGLKGRLAFVDQTKYTNLQSWSHKAYEIASQYMNQ
jgi:hypothetical protein